ncbi:HAD hydrolase family protein [Psychroserpens algicola]|uniref:HAD hydrolase family protein n=1 Tax=Psychroserpens algicola TaxID=1719034 RepID=A0ABT0HDC9_9FLAO|nr:HAD hydrolase family protein [Psychroserpens algicola]MCK8481840.1 HAD hydrolase family protein [Psychroserpens algicola]
MGKPFESELSKIEETFLWGNALNLTDLSNFINEINNPIYIVGSGGSLSACHFAAELFEKNGKFAKAITPLELLNLEDTLSHSSVLFISASGRNVDIKNAFKKAIETEPKSIGLICMKEDSPISILAKKHSIAKTFEYLLPSGKDGFLATNSLIAFFIILNNVFNKNVKNSTLINDDTKKTISSFLKETSTDYTYTLLYNGFGKSVALDIESKCSEAALAPTLLSDYRNFGHGRHHWFAKRSNSAIIAICNKDDKILCNKTLNLLPNDIPKLILESKFSGSFSAIDLLVKSFFLIQALGKKMDIDPGKPGVPEFGSKLYHLPYSSIFKKKKEFKLSNQAILAIKRKTKSNDLSRLNKKEMDSWIESYNNFISTIKKADFGLVLFDYDGTLCSSAERFSGVSNEMAKKLNEIVENGFLIGVITGRGKSVREDFQRILPKIYWDKVIVGYYNGADCGLLSNNSLPKKDIEVNSDLIKVNEKLKDVSELYSLNIEVRPKQITIQINDKSRWEYVRNLIIQILKTNNINNIQILESSHSMDIIPDSISKLNILPFCGELLKKHKLSEQILIMGDKGQWSGNDFILLDSEFGLSVDEVSSKYGKCWNIASLANRNTAATLEYLNRLEYNTNGMKFKINK